MPQAITVTTRPDGVAVLTFDQPGSKANVLTRELWTEFGNALAALALRTEVKGLVLASAKPGIFIAGADLKLLANARTPNDPDVRAFIEQGLRGLEQLEALPFPTCAAIDGAALGGGLEVALACDYRICGTNPKVQLGLPEVNLGLIPGWGGTQRLSRLAGLTNAVEMVTTGRSVNGGDAPSMRLAGTTVDSDSLVAASASLITTIALAPMKIGAIMRGQQPQPGWQVQRIRKSTTVLESDRAAFLAPTATTTAASEAIRVMTEGAGLPLYDAIKIETEAFMRLAGSDESKRLIGEFFASRKK